MINDECVIKHLTLLVQMHNCYSPTINTYRLESTENEERQKNWKQFRRTLYISPHIRVRPSECFDRIYRFGFVLFSSSWCRRFAVDHPLTDFNVHCSENYCALLSTIKFEIIIVLALRSLNNNNALSLCKPKADSNKTKQSTTHTREKQTRDGNARERDVFRYLIIKYKRQEIQMDKQK